MGLCRLILFFLFISEGLGGAVSTNPFFFFLFQRETNPFFFFFFRGIGWGHLFIAIQNYS